MPLWAEFCGGTYLARSQAIADDQAVNVYVETRDVAGSQKQTTLYGTPGLSLVATASTTGCRGWLSENGRTFVVVGTTWYEINTTTYVLTSRATVIDDGFPVDFVSNGQGGNQIGCLSGGTLYVLKTTTNVVTTPALPFSGAVTAAFLDGYTLINQANSPIVWFSALEDMGTWDALDFFARSGTSDNIIAIAVMRDRVWCFGSQTTTLFYDSGNATNPFIPYPGTTTQIGLVNPYAFVQHKDALYWIGQTTQGQRLVAMATEPTAQRISTSPIDLFLSRCTSLANAEMLVYEQEGHLFVALTCPSSPEDINTYVFDAKESLWHARAGWDSTTGQWTRWRPRGSVRVENLVLVGDYATGALYALSLDTYDDNGTVLRRLRRTPYLSNSNQLVFLDQFELGIQPGVGLTTGQGSIPDVTLNVSRNYGNTWVSAGFGTMGAVGEYFTRAIWRRLGRSRGDRLVIEVTQTDPVKCVWGPGAWLTLSQGTDQR